MSSAPLRDRFLGSILGLAIGDSLGAPYETLSAHDIFHQFGPPDVVASNPSGEVLRYTDDTQMMIGVVETLIKHGRIDQESLARTFAVNYQPDRGYGKGARRIIETIQAGGDWRTAAETIFPGGSLGNGAAMRVVPVGLYFHDDLDAVWENARQSALPTHRHQVGIEAAQIMALAVALAVKAEVIDRREFLKTLLNRSETEEIRWALKTAIRLRRGDSIAVLGHTVEAHRSTVTAIAAFAACPTDYSLAVGRVIGLGGDTDTLAAMTGALCGAFGGMSAIPPGLVGSLENKELGRDYIHGLAEQLYEQHVQRTGISS